jgi:hypothetical protein
MSVIFVEGIHPGGEGRKLAALTSVYSQCAWQPIKSRSIRCDVAPIRVMTAKLIMIAKADTLIVTDIQL